MSKQAGTPLMTRPQPTQTARRRSSKIPSFSVSRRRMVLMQGDVILTLIAVLIALWWWAYNAHDPFTLRFILLRSYWFLILPLFWLILARASDYYSLRVAAHLVSSLTRLAWITLEMLVIYRYLFFLS